ncbi:hypothetical protein [Nonomuraea typhae]|uniref:Uncharacterized protein n=1 Tax=Nonomuraea typhae TaxID=2603600 RepID=A0ABW7YLP5_9ACTN
MNRDEYLAGEELALAMLRRYPHLPLPEPGAEDRRVYPVSSVDDALLWVQAMNTLPTLARVSRDSIELAGELRGLKMLVALRRLDVAAQIPLVVGEQWLLPKQIHDAIANPPENALAYAPWMEDER